MVTVLERPDRRCGATNRQGERCGNWAIKGGRVCRFHGGALKRTKVAAARRVAETQAFEALARHKAAPVDNPLEAFRQLAGEVVAVKDWLGGIVERLQEMRYRGTSGEQIRGELAAYTGALDMCRRVLADYGRLNVDERLGAITVEQRRQQAMVAEHINGVLTNWLLPAPYDDLARRLRKHAIEALLAAVDANLAGRPDWGDGRHSLPGGLWEEVQALQAVFAAPKQMAALERELERTRVELEAVVKQRDDLLDALRRNRSVPVLAIEGPKPAEVVVERESITVPDDPAPGRDVVPPPARRSPGGRAGFRTLSPGGPDAWDRYR